MSSKVQDTSEDISRNGDPLLSERKPQIPPRKKNKKLHGVTESKDIRGPVSSEKDKKNNKDDTKATGRGTFEKDDKSGIIQQSADCSEEGNQKNDAAKEKNITGE